MIFRHSPFDIRAAIARLTVLTVLSAACAQPAAAPSPPTPATATAATATAATPTATPSPSPSPAVSEFMTSEGYWTLGKADAKVLFVDSSDFGCTTCGAYVLGTEPKLVDDYVKTGLIRFQFRHQLNYAKASELASQAAECAGDQQKFYAMRDALFANQAKVVTPADPGLLKALAQDLKLEAAQFASCLDSEKYLAKVKAQDQARRQAGWTRRPTFDINGIRVQGNVAYEILKDAIDRALKQ